MKKITVSIALFICLFLAGCGDGDVVGRGEGAALSASALHPFGRALMTDQQVELIGSASHFGYTFEGDSSVLFAQVGTDTSYHNYLQYEVDGRYVAKVRITGGSTLAIPIRAGKPGKHIVWVYKTTEAHTGPVFIVMIRGRRLEALERPKAPLIEFIGNSITCGALADPSEVPCGKGVYQDQHNAYFAYGPRLARALKANFIVSSVSGIGIYRNWNSDGPTMPQVYEKADFQLAGSRTWDFGLYKPDVVSIALGTNDYSDGDGVKPRLPFDSANFVGRYIEFVKLVKSKYPSARIALLSSPMVSGEKREQFQRCLGVVKKAIDGTYPADKPVALYFFKPMMPGGCSFHPSVEDHGLMATELEPFFRGLL